MAGKECKEKSEKEKMKRRKITAWILCLTMILTVMPQFALTAMADPTDPGTVEKSLAWGEEGSDLGGTAKAGVRCYGVITEIKGLTFEEIGAMSTDTSVVPDACIWMEYDEKWDEITVYAWPVKAGEAEIILYEKADEKKAPLLTTTPLNVSEPDTLEIYEGQAGTPWESRWKTPFKVQYTVENSEIATADNSRGKVTGKKVGTTRLHVTCETIPEMDYSYELRVRAKEPSTGIWYNGEKTTTLDWDPSKGESIPVTIKYANAEGYDAKEEDIGGSACVYNSNTDVAEIEPGANGVGIQGIKPKKNGTAVFHVYKNRIMEYDAAENGYKQIPIGKLTLHVSGYEETSDPEAGWKAETVPQGDEYGGRIRMKDYPVEQNAFNEAAGENRITQPIKAGAITFRMELTSTAKKYTVDDAKFETWKNYSLPLLNIYEQKSDGSIGEVVASYKGGGYTVDKDSLVLDMNNPNATQAQNTTSIDVKVRSGVLKKGKNYIMQAEPAFTTWYTDKPLNNPATYKSLSAGLRIPVRWQFSTVAGARTVTLDQTKAEVEKGQSITLTAEMNQGLEDEADDMILWSSSNEAVATVDNNGKVTAKKAGTAVITAKAAEGKAEAKCTVTVPAVKVTGVSLDVAKATLIVGSSKTLKATVKPADATNQAVTWRSSAPKVAKVDQKGKVSALSAGTATITAKTADGAFTAKAVITVKAVKVTGVTLNSSKATLEIGKTKTLKATVKPTNATNQAVTWKTSDSKVAKVSSKGVVTAAGPGKTTITVTTKDGSFKKTCVITVKPKTPTLTLSGKTKAVTIKYKKVTGASGYQIYRAKSKTGKYTLVTTRSQSKSASYTNTKLSRKTTYYYKIRSYKTVKGVKIYSNFSTPKSVKTK